jgi:4-O-beta-D-mannosyl-D-glucose phosphorylase
MSKDFITRKQEIYSRYEKLIGRSNIVVYPGNGVYERYKYPALTSDHIPPHWMYDLNPDTNPHLMIRQGINSVFNSGAIKLDGKYLMVPRIEGFNVKSFFGVAESDNGVDCWRFWDKPIHLPSAGDPETNVYDMRLTQHEDGWIYGLFCAERKDDSMPDDSSAAIASCGIARSKDLREWERLPDLKSNAQQQRNCVLHPEFVNGKYMIYTRPQSGFIETGDSGISVGFTIDMTSPVINEELLVDPRTYHTVKEVKNGQGPAPLKTDLGWLHLGHAVRRTAAGLRYVLYLFLTDIHEPWKIIRRPEGHFIEPMGDERVGDVSNVIFSNGWIMEPDGRVFIYYASSDTRMHLATTELDRLLDYLMNTPEDPGKTEACLINRLDLINKNQGYY